MMRSTFVRISVISILLIICAFIIQFSVPVIIGSDGFLHGRMALLVSEGGFLQALPQAHFSWFANRFSDKDFVYHLYLAPFVRQFGVMQGTKIAAWIATSFLYTVISFLIIVYAGKQKKLSYVIPFLILLSPQFLRDTAEARPLVFAYALLPLGIHVALRERANWVLLISFIFGLVHLSAWTLPACIGAIMVYHWFYGESVRKKIFFVSLIGYALSFFVHPNFPNSVYYVYLNGIVVPFFAAKTGILELGAEFFPLTTQELLVKFPVVVLGVIGIMLLRPTLNIHKTTAYWLIPSIIFIFFGLISRRMLTQAYPLFLIFIMSYLESRERTHISQHTRIPKMHLIGLYLVAIMLFSVLSVISFDQLKNTLYGEKLYGEHFVSISSYLSSRAPVGARVFHANWSDSQYLIGLAPKQEYIVTLDPIYMYDFDPQLYELYRQTSYGNVRDPYEVIQNVFGATYIYAGKNYFSRFIEQLRSDNRFHIVKEDDLGILATTDQVNLK